MQRENEQELIDMATNYMSLYGVNVNMARAIPFIKDGIKPIIRRILYACYKYYRENLVKTSVLIGDVGKFSPHGEQGLNEVIAKMAQPFSNNVPLLTGHGNVGNRTTGDDFAASRYYSVKISKFAMDVLFSEFDGKVDMIPNYDGTMVEPFMFPAKFPIILLNGTAGIGYTLSTDIAPYNLNEIADATIKIINFDKEFRHTVSDYIKTHNDQLSEFLSSSLNTFNVMTIDERIIKSLHLKRPKIHLIPDSPTGCDIFIRDEESFVMQAGYELDNANYVITITSTPYIKYLDDIDRSLRQIQDSAEPITEILSAEEESEDVTDGIKYVIRCKPCNLMHVVSKIFKRVQGLRFSVSAKNINVVDSTYMTKKFTPAEILGDWISQRFLDKRGWFLRDLVEKNKKLNMLEGKAYMLSGKNLDRTLNVFRNHKKAEIINALVAEYKGKVTSSQAAYVYELPLYRITTDEHDATVKEIKEVMEKIEYIRSVTTDDDKIKDIIINDLLEIKDKYGYPRRSKIINNTDTADISIGVVSITPNGNVIFGEVEDPKLISSDVKPITGQRVCLIDTNGNFVWADTTKIAHNHEIPLTSISSIKMDACISAVSNQDNNIIILTNEGKLKWLPISKIPSRYTGKPIIPMNITERIVSIIEVRDQCDDLLIYTNDGMGKRIQMSDINKSGSITANGQQIIKADNVAGMFVLNSNKPLIAYVTCLGKVRVNYAKFLSTGKKYDALKPIIALSNKDDLVAVFCCDDTQELTLHHIDGKRTTVSIKPLGISTINTPPVRPRHVPATRIVRVSIV